MRTTLADPVAKGGEKQSKFLRRTGRRIRKDLKKNGMVYLIFLPVFAYVFVFAYLPMFGVVMAFQDFRITAGVFGSPWCGFDNFALLFSGSEFLRAIRNTVIFALFNLLLGFPVPIVFALFVTQVRSIKFRRICQTLTYLPTFVASVVMVNIMQNFFNEGGAITSLLSVFGLEKQNWLANPNPPAFWLIYTFMGVWQSFGYGSIMFVAAISNVSEEQKEAAVMDGANRWQQVWHVIFPTILPLVVMMLTLQIGVVFKAGYDKILLMYTPQTYGVTDTVYTYTYRMAFGRTADYGLSAASGLFQSVVCTVLLVFSNWLSKKVTQSSLF